MEPRAGDGGHYDKETDRSTLIRRLPGRFRPQEPNGRRLLGIKPAQMRVVTGNVGGSFGMKGSPYPEYAGLLHAAREDPRPSR
jgi:carbon-monoxide dehydrogenase large subunit